MTNREKAEILLKKMTLTEKVGQLTMKGGCILDEQGVPESLDVVERIRQGRVGNLIIHANDMSEAVDYFQRIATTETRLKIPLLINADMVHGLETIYPVPIAAACSFDTDLVKRCSAAQAEESVICGIRYTNAPMVDIARDPRWGRIVESQGEDPYLAGEMAKAYVEGFQNSEHYVMATLKHFAGYGACEGGRDYNVCEANENTMLNTYLVPFREGVAAGADSVMTAFNTIENIPATANKKYIKDILRDTFHFEGITLSDAIAVYELIPYGYCNDVKECALRCIQAGLDIDLGSDVYHCELENLVKEGIVSEKCIDEAVLRVLTKKYDLGLFDCPYSVKEKKARILCDEFLELSYRLGLESAVLLENNGVLPITKDKKILLVGRFSASCDLLGCWQESHFTDRVVTLEQGLKNIHMQVVGVVESYDIAEVESKLPLADIVLFSFGESSAENGEARSHHNLHVSESVHSCFEYIKAKGKDVVCLEFTGRPLILGNLTAADGLVLCWHLGHRTGDVLASLLTGKENFSGKLSVSVPTHEGQLPMYYAKKKLGRPYRDDNQEWRFQSRYDDGENSPKYAFGYGKSYARFSYANLRVEGEGETLAIVIDITNSSNVEGVEIVQLYICDKTAEVVLPERELKDFRRVYIPPRETRSVTFMVTQDKLCYYHTDRGYYADDGIFDVFVGGDSNAENKLSFVLKGGKLFSVD